MTISIRIVSNNNNTLVLTTLIDRYRNVYRYWIHTSGRHTAPSECATAFEGCASSQTHTHTHAQPLQGTPVSMCVCVWVCVCEFIN